MTCLAAVLTAAAALAGAAPPSEEVALDIAVLVGRIDDKAPARPRDADMAPSAVLYAGGDSDDKVREQVIKRGKYIAANLAYNSDYGVLIEDPTQLTDLAAGAMAGSDDVVAVVIRNTKGKVLVRRGAEIKDLPPLPSPTVDVVDATLVSGERVLLFRAGVTARDKYQEPGAPSKPAGGVDVAIRLSHWEDLKTRWTKLLETLKDSYRLTDLEIRRMQTEVPFGLNDVKVIDAVTDGPKVEIVLIGLSNAAGGSPLATYRVRIKDGTKLLAEQPAVAIAPKARAIIGTRNGPAAPYLFLVLESRGIVAPPQP
jgi:hypothetical protein